MWYFPRSIDAPPRRHVIEATAQALRVAGFEVAVEIDAAPRDQTDAARHLVERSQARQGRLEGRAARLEAEADAQEQSAQRLGEGIPFGQPILVGHHSEGTARRRLKRIKAHSRKSVEAQKAAGQARQAARGSVGHQSSLESPGVVARRIDRLEAQERQLVARLGRTGFYAGGAELSAGYRQQLEELLEHNRAQLAHWQQVRQAQVGTGEVIEYSSETIAAGDAVLVRRQWYRVVRANKATVTVAGHFGAQRIRYHELHGHHTAAQMDAAREVTP